ncbi:MAG: hypothetical protein AB7U29_14935 [Desulfobulbus sp.]
MGRNRHSIVAVHWEEGLETCGDLGVHPVDVHKDLDTPCAILFP